MNSAGFVVRPMMATDEIRCPEQPGSPMAPVAVSSASSLDSFVSVGMPQAVLPINVISAEMSRNDRSDMISKEQSSIQEPPSVAPDCVPSGAARDCAPSGPAPDCVPSGCVVQSSDQRRTRDSIFADVPAAPEISAAMPQPMVIASDEAGQHSQNVISTNASSCSAITAAIHPGGLAIGYQSTFPALLPRVENVTMFPAEQLGNRVTSTVACTNSTPEFLYQLTKMLTDDNRDIIEWTNGKIEVHSPHKLETDVLKKYFRHCKFASFQRQLNYFGFRKLAGKGKMAPCSYVNEAAGVEINSLLLIKRKSSLAQLAKESCGKKSKEESSDSCSHQAGSSNGPPVNPILASIFNRTKEAMKKLVADPVARDRPALGYTSTSGMSSNVAGASAYEAIARSAAGRGIRHGYQAPSQQISTANNATTAVVLSNTCTNSSGDQQQHPQSSDQQTQQQPLYQTVGASNVFANDTGNDSLSQLENNFRNSLMQPGENLDLLAGTDPTPLSQMQNPGGMMSSDAEEYYTGFLSRNSSLIDLAMIAPVDDSFELQDKDYDDSNLFGFIDFPNPDVIPPTMTSENAGSKDSD